MKTVSYKTWEQNINEFIRKKKNVIYGARALNANLSPLLKRHTNDFDVWSRKPRAHAEELAKELGQERYHVKRVQLPTGKFVYRVYHKSGQLTADFTRIPSKEKYFFKYGIRYQTLMHQKERLEEILSDTTKRYRHLKAQMDLNKINYYLRQLEE